MQKTSPKKFARATRVFLALVLGVAIALLAAEVIVRALDVDWALVEANVYYQMVDLDSHVPSEDPILLYELKPGSKHSYQGLYGPYEVGVNSLGVRGPDYSRGKPPGVFRILCLGGSNVYGAMLDNPDTWPARLESQLNRLGATRFEVFNLGLCAYAGLQMVHYGVSATRKFDPDLIIFALSNTDFRAFLHGKPVPPHFERNPELWLDFYPSQTLRLLPGSDAVKVNLLSYWRSLRFALSATSTFIQKKRPWISVDHESKNVRVVREFLSNPPGGIPVAVFISPHFDPSYHREYTDGIDVPLFALSADGFSFEYNDIHPPALVADWYAQNLVTWLQSQSLVPLPEKGPTQ
jgi:hypothetical protein